MHRFFFTATSLHPTQIVDLTPLSQQLTVVLRLPLESRIVLLDGQGNEFVTKLVQVTRNHVQGQVLEQRLCLADPVHHVTLYQCTLKADKFEWVLQKATELGVSAFAPVIAERSIVRPAQAVHKKYERWSAIVREAAEQSGRGRIPALHPPLEWSAALAHAQGVRLLPWKASDGAEFSQVPQLPAPLVSAGTSQISLLIGPEGGLTAHEVKLAQAAGWQVISLGRRILRAETAAVAAVAAIMDRLGELGAVWPATTAPSV